MQTFVQRAIGSTRSKSYYKRNFKHRYSFMRKLEIEEYPLGKNTNRTKFVSKLFSYEFAYNIK